MAAKNKSQIDTANTELQPLKPVFDAAAPVPEIPAPVVVSGPANPEIVEAVNAAMPQGKAADYDPFDPKNLLVSQDFIDTAKVKKLITNIPIRKPDKQVFFRIHPKEPGCDWRDVFNVIDLKNDREQYIVSGRMIAELKDEMVRKEFRLGISAKGDLFFMPIGLPSGKDGKDNSWWGSLREMCDIAETKWIRAIPNQSVKGYDAYQSQDVLDEPDWVEALQGLTWWDCVKIAIKNYLIDSVDHAVVKQLRGQR
jgi:hypothetical protein